MNRVLDKLCIYLSVVVVCWGIGSYITDSWIWGGAIAILGLVVAICLGKLFVKRGSKSKLSEYRLCLLLEGKPLSSKHLQHLYPPKGGTESDGEFYEAQDGSLVCNLYGWSKPGEEAASKIYRRAKEGDYTLVRIFADGVDRKTLSILAYLPCPYEFVRLKTLMKAQDQASLPHLPNKKKKVQLREMARSIPNPKMAFALSWIALSTLLMSYLLPIKTYYRVTSLVLALLAVAVYVWSLKVKN